MLVKYERLPGAVVVDLGEKGRDEPYGGKVWGSGMGGSKGRGRVKAVARLVAGPDANRLGRDARHPDDEPGDCPGARQSPREVAERLLSRSAVGRDELDPVRAHYDVLHSSEVGPMEHRHGSLSGWGTPTRFERLVEREAGRADFGASAGGWSNSAFGRVLLRAIGIVAVGEEVEIMTTFPSGGGSSEDGPWPEDKLVLFVVRVTTCDRLDSWDFTNDQRRGARV